MDAVLALQGVTAGTHDAASVHRAGRLRVEGLDRGDIVVVADGSVVGCVANVVDRDVDGRLVARVGARFAPGADGLAVPAMDAVARRLLATACAEVRLAGPFPGGSGDGSEAMGHGHGELDGLPCLVATPGTLASRETPAPGPRRRHGSRVADRQAPLARVAPGIPMP